jgi:hypothetical protein
VPPLEGATVHPEVFAAPLVVADRDRFATTDGNGQFELIGVLRDSSRVHVQHPAYQDVEAKLPARGEAAKDDVSVEVTLRHHVKIT